MEKERSVGDIYCYPGTHILINKLGVKDEAELLKAEREITSIRIAELLSKKHLRNGYSLEYLQELHAYIFQDIYDWAGTIRNVDIQKGKSLFCSAKDIESTAGSIFTRLHDSADLRGLFKTEFIIKLSEYMRDLNNLHPFRDGNGRTLRVFFKELSVTVGHSIDYGLSDKDTHILADVAAMNGNMEVLRSMLHKIVDQPKQHIQKPSILGKMEQYKKIVSEQSDKQGKSKTYDQEIE